MNTSAYVSDPNYSTDPYGLSPDITIPGLKGDPRMKDRTPLVQATDRALNGTSANASAALGLGITHSTTYAGGGVLCTLQDEL